MKEYTDEGVGEYGAEYLLPAEDGDVGRAVLLAPVDGSGERTVEGPGDGLGVDWCRSGVAVARILPISLIKSALVPRGFVME